MTSWSWAESGLEAPWSWIPESRGHWEGMGLKPGAPGPPGEGQPLWD